MTIRHLSTRVSLALAATVVVTTLIVGTTIVVLESRRDEADVLETARATATGLSQLCQTSLEAALDGGWLTTGDLFDGTPVPIQGITTIDAGGTQEEKHFHKRYDWYTDRVWVKPFDAALSASPDFIFAICNDLDGYIPTSNTISMQPGRGPFRAKRWDETRTPLHLKAAKSLEPVLIQPYFRDGNWLWDVAVPIYVHGQHWGAARVGVSQTRIAERRLCLALELGGLLALAGTVVVLVGAWRTRRAVRPLVELTETARRISLGEELDATVPGVELADEVGDMARSVRRLQRSMQKAMDRLQRPETKSEADQT